MSSAAPAGNATPCVLRRRCPASVTRRGYAARPRDDCRQPNAQSDREPANRWAVVLDVANAAATGADRTDRDANGRRWPAEPAAERLSTAARTYAGTATANGRTCETADSNAPGRPIGGVGQAPQAVGRAASPIPIGSPWRPERRDASRVAWPAILPPSMILPGRHIGEGQDATRVNHGRLQRALERTRRRCAAAGQ
jgi:hypothetical protein